MPSISIRWHVGWQGVLAAVMYGASSTAMAFVNKAVLSAYAFNFPFFILSLQMVLTVSCLEVLSWRRLVSLPQYTFEAGWSFLWPSVFCGLHSTLSLYALHGLNIPMYGALKRCTPLVTLVLSVVLLKKGLPTLLLTSSILVITGGCFVAALGDLTYDPGAYTLGLLSMVAQGLYLSLVQYYAENSKLSSLHILQLNSYNTLWPYTVICILVEDPIRLLMLDCWTDPAFIFLFVLLLVLGCFFNYFLFLCTALNSAITTSLVGVLKNALQTIIGFFAFGGVTYHPLNVAGLTMNTLGGLMYVYAKFHDKKKVNTPSSLPHHMKRAHIPRDQNLNHVLYDVTDETPVIAAAQQRINASNSSSNNNANSVSNSIGNSPGGQLLDVRVS